MRLVVLALAVGACRREQSPPPPPPPAPPIIVAPTGPAEPLPGNGRLVPGFRVPGVDARFGTTLPIGDHAALWLIAGDRLRYDEDGDGDLADDPVHAGDLALGTRWLRIRDGELYRQEVAVRRGSLGLTPAMAFALVGVGGRYDAPEMFVGIDVNRDGQIDLETLDHPELFHAFEKALTLDGRPYALTIDPAGEALTLRPLDHPLPARPALTEGSLAPAFSTTTLDGAPFQLSQLRGRSVLVDLWSVTCPPCVKALPRLAALRSSALEIVGIADARDTAAAVRQVLGPGEHGIQAIDDAVQTLYRVDRFPMYFLLDREGRIVCARCSLDRIEGMLPRAGAASMAP